jgi:hypothetical protein
MQIFHRFAAAVACSLAFVSSGLGQAVDLDGQRRIKTTAVAGIRSMGQVAPPPNLSPFWHAENDTAQPVETHLQFSDDGSCAVNLFARVTDPEADSIVLTKHAGAWPAGCTEDYDNGMISSIATTVSTGSVIVRACEDGNPSACDDWDLTWEVVAVGSGAPILVSAIPDQSGFQGVAFSYDTSIHFDEPDSDTITFTSASLPVGGLSINSAGVISGTPTAAAVSASPISVVVRATDVDGFVEDTLLVDIDPVPGATHNIATGDAAFNCTTAGVDPGDVVVIQGDASTGVRGPLVISNCTGTSSAPITIKNNTAADEQTIIRKTTAGTGGFVFACTNCKYVVIDGTGKWVGAAAGTLGVTISGGVRTENRVACGLKVDRSATAGRPAAFFKLNGTTGIDGSVTVRGVCSDGIDHADAATEGSGGGICFDMNDHSIPATAHPGKFRQDITWENLYGRMCGANGGEGFYLGANGPTGDVPLKNIIVRNSIMDDSGAECVNIKMNYEGANVVANNSLYECGASTAANGQHCISLQNPGNYHIYGNWCEDAQGDGISIKQSAPPTGFSRYLTIENNFIVRPLGIGNWEGYGIQVFRNANGYDYDPVLIRHNTIVTTVSHCITFGENETGLVTDNILAGCGGSAVFGGPNTSAGNRVGAVDIQGFVNIATDAAEDYHLTAISAACGQATGTSPATDYDEQNRPIGTNEDRGADESASCP